MAADKQIQRDINRGLAWIGLASSTVGALDILANVLILALWVSPAEYGIATLAVSLFPALDRATDLGLFAAVIQRDDHSDSKISTVFWLNVGMSVVLLAALAFAIGPGLSWLYGQPLVGAMLTVYGLKLVWQNVYFIPAAMMQRELRFKELSVIRMLANIAEFAGKVGFAAAGYGIWCFVLGPLARVLITGIGTQLRHPWRPRLIFRLREALGWAAYGFKISAHKILFQLYTNADYTVVGAVFGVTAVGYYRFAYELVLEPARVISEVVQQIAFPVFSRLKNNAVMLREQFISFSRMNLVVMLGFLAMLFLCADLLVEVVYGVQWLPAVAAVKILSAVAVLRAMSFMVPPLLDGMGYPGRTLLYTAVASIVLPACFVIAALFAVDSYALGDLWTYGAAVDWLSPAPVRDLAVGDVHDFLSVAWAWVVGYPVAFFVLAAMALRVLDLRASQYIRRVSGIVVAAAIALGGGYAIRWGMAAVGAPDLVTLIAVAGGALGIFALLLAILEGITVAQVVRSLKGGEPAAEASTAAPDTLSSGSMVSGEEG